MSKNKQEYKTIKVSPNVKRSLKVKAAKEDTTVGILADKIIKERLVAEGDLLDE